MSEEKVELVRRWIDAWNERDYDLLDTLVQEDMEFHGLVEQADRPRVTRGSAEFRRRTELVDGELERFRMELLEVVDAGERVAMIFEMSGSGRLSGAPIRFTDAAVVAFREGRIARIEVFGTRGRALEAAGLSE